MSDAAKNTTQLENNLRSTVRASGENAESMENLSQACQDVGSTGLLARQGLEGVRGTAEALPAPIIRTSTALIQITGAFMSFTAIVNGVQHLKMYLPTRMLAQLKNWSGDWCSNKYCYKLHSYLENGDSCYGSRY